MALPGGGQRRSSSRLALNSAALGGRREAEALLRIEGSLASWQRVLEAGEQQQQQGAAAANAGGSSPPTRRFLQLGQRIMRLNARLWCGGLSTPCTPAALEVMQVGMHATGLLNVLRRLAMGGTIQRCLSQAAAHACRDAIKGELGEAGTDAEMHASGGGGGEGADAGAGACADSDADNAGAEEAEEEEGVPPLALVAMHSDSVVDYGSDSDVPLLRGDSLVRRRSLIHLRESRRRDSIATMCARSPAPTLRVLDASRLAVDSLTHGFARPFAWRALPCHDASRPATGFLRHVMDLHGCRRVWCPAHGYPLVSRDAREALAGSPALWKLCSTDTSGWHGMLHARSESICPSAERVGVCAPGETTERAWAATRPSGSSWRSAAARAAATRTARGRARWTSASCAA
jgi:hypothetical protein